MESLPLPYETHPAFRFGDLVEHDLTAADLRVFVDTYARLETEALSPAGRRHAEATAKATLGALFAELGRNADADFHNFVTELGVYCQRLLAADLDHFAAQQRDVTSVSRQDWLDALDSRRFYFAKLSPGALDELLAVTREPVAGLRANAARGRVTREDLSINGGAIALRVVHILDRDFQRQGICDAVSAYARRTMRVTGVAVELSVPSSTWWRSHYEVPPARTLYAHTDEGLANPKSIVYLTDVDAHTGPMSAYPGCEEVLGLSPLQKLVGRVVNSVGTDPNSPLHTLYVRATPRVFGSPVFRRHFAMLPKTMRYNSHFGWDVLPDSSLERALVTAETPLVGPAGTLVVFDGARLVHRGGMVERGERIALQVVFSAPRSPLAGATDRLVAARYHASTARKSVGQRFLRLRQRVGATMQQYSPKPHARLIRDVSRVLPELACIDIGASYYPHPPWEVFRASAHTTWIAVEPNSENTGYLDDWRWPSKPQRLGIGLSERGGEQLLHVTNVDSGSSLLPPVINDDMVHRVPHHDYFFPITEKRIATRSLGDVIAGQRELAGLPLFIKLDTQGTELSILRGAAHALAHQVVGIETEATLLANPIMVGSGKFSEVTAFLETYGFELLQLRPIEGGPNPPSSALSRRTYLNECDAVFCLRRSVLAKRPAEHQLAALGFYLSYHLYAEARALLDTIDGFDASCTRAGVDPARLRRLLDS